MPSERQDFFANGRHAGLAGGPDMPGGEFSGNVPVKFRGGGHGPQGTNIMSIQVVIADDEPLARQLLVRLVREQAGLSVVGAADNGETALRMIRELAPDLVFLDIRMPKLTGVALAAAVRELPVAPLVVFVTAYDDHAAEAFDLDVLDYLVKPIEKARFARAVERARKAICARQVQDLGAKIAAVAGNGAAEPDDDATEPYVIVRQRDELIRIPECDIFWLEAKSQYVVIHTREARYIVAEPLARYHARLVSESFRRVHRSAVVNVTKVRHVLRKLNGVHELRLANGEGVPLSRSRKDLVDRLLGECLDNRNAEGRDR